MPPERRVPSSASATGPLVVVHGGGRAIDAELRARGREPRFVDGLRVTDAAALDAVVSRAGGTEQHGTRRGDRRGGGRAVGLTGADGFIGRSTRAGMFTTVSGEGSTSAWSGSPMRSMSSLSKTCTRLGYVPVVASIGVDAAGSC